MNFTQLTKIIETDGWFLVRQKGSHRQYHHTNKDGTVTIAYHKGSIDVPIGTLKSVLKQAQIDK